MEYVKLKNTELNVSRICFGGEQLGGFSLGSYDVNDTILAARDAIEKGINFFDTADCYGLGVSESNLGKIIKDFRQDIIVSTKFGVRINPNSVKSRVCYDNRSSYLKEALLQSLKRLQTDYIDLYQVHYWDKVTPIEEVFFELERYCEKGVIRYYGVSNFSVSDIVLDEFPHLLSHSQEFSLANREKEDLINKTELAFFAYGVLGQGILTGRYDKKTIFDDSDRRKNEKYINFHGKKLEQNLKIVEEMKKIVQMYSGRSISQLAIKWVLEYLNQSVVIAGIKNSRQLQDNLNVFNWSLSKEEVRLLDKISNF